jgi:G:T-mismatch repair DNA endonuclease (very short patch repair protein)/DNA-binding phage protein
MRPEEDWVAVLEKVVETCQPLATEFRRMPRKNELIKAGHREVWLAAKHIGWSKVARAVEETIPPEKMIPPTLPHHAMTWLELETELRAIVAFIGHMPGWRDLQVMGRGSLHHQIARFGGFGAVADKIGATRNPLARGRRWDSVENLREPLAAITSDSGVMPSLPWLYRNSRFDLASAINKFGGIRKVAQDLDLQYAGYETWPSIEIVRRRLAPIVEDLGRMPTQSELVSTDGPLLGAIGKYGGLEQVARECDFPYRPANVRHSEIMAAKTLKQGWLRSKLELRAGDLLGPLGFRPHAINIMGHSFDYGRVGQVIEINGCYWHDHRALKPNCPTESYAKSRYTSPLSLFEKDERTRALATEHGLSLLELWECEKDSWQNQLTEWLANQ